MEDCRRALAAGARGLAAAAERNRAKAALLYATIDQQRELSNSFLLKLNETNERLMPLLEENTRRIMADVQRRRAARAKAASEQPHSADQPPPEPS